MTANPEKWFYMFHKNKDDEDYYLIDEVAPLKVDQVYVHPQKPDYRYVSAVHTQTSPTLEKFKDVQA